MEHQKIARNQHYYSSSANNNFGSIPQQQSSTVTKSSSSTVNSNSFPSSNSRSSGNPDFARSKFHNNKGRSYHVDRQRSSNKNKPAHSNHGGRGYQREPASYKQSNEVRGVAHSAEKTKHGEDASHLLNFTYAPIRGQEDGSRSGGCRWGGRSRRQPIHTKEQFLQAHCQFVVKAPNTDGDYIQNMAEVDKMVEWDSIEQVILTDEQISSCPICMEVPVAAKMTKCAHIYCWPCLLHYLSLSDKPWARCPICFDSIEARELKSVVTAAVTRPKVGEQVKFQLMKRERESLYVRPKANWKASQAGHMFTPQDDDVDVKCSKLLAATASYIESIVCEERRQLLHLLHQEDTQSLEASYIQAALDSLTQRLESISGASRPVEQQADVQQVVVSTPVRLAPDLQPVSYADAFDDLAVDEEVSGQETTTEAGALPVEGEGSVANNLLTPAVGQEASVRERKISSNSSSDGVETEQIAADLVLPPTGTQPGRSSGSKRTEVYYFYQAADGQHLYLHSINTRMLAAEYGSLELAPSLLTATVVEMEENSLTQDLRKRLKYLSHLPLYSQFSVCEVSLRPPIVSSACLAHFSDEVNRRKKMRNRRQRTEAKQFQRAQAEERRRMGHYPDMALPLNSDTHFPLSAEPPAFEEFSPLVPVEAENQAVDEHAVPSRQHGVPLTTPYSFSQAMKVNSAAPAWPKMQAAYVRSPGPQAVKSTDDKQSDDEECSAPSFQQSFSTGFSLHDFSKMAVNGDESSNGNGGNKRKKKKKQQVLFTTSSHRANV